MVLKYWVITMQVYGTESDEFFCTQPTRRDMSKLVGALHVVVVHISAMDYGLLEYRIL